jgi:hypothetical protein
VGDLADLRPELLRPHGQRRQPALVDQVEQRHGRKYQEADDGEDRVDQHDRRRRGQQHHDHTDGHRQRRQRAPGRLDVGVGVGEQLPRRVPVVPCQRQPQILPGDGPA